MALSDELLKLSSQSRELEQSIEATKDQNQSRLTERKTALDAQLKATRKKLDGKVARAGDELTADWNDAQKSVSDAFQSLRAGTEARHENLSAMRAGRAADEAEMDALDAIDFAIYAIQEAEWAVLDAADARDKADAKAGEAAQKAADAS